MSLLGGLRHVALAGVVGCASPRVSSSGVARGARDPAPQPAAGRQSVEPAAVRSGEAPALASWAERLEEEPEPATRAALCAGRLPAAGKSFRDCHARACAGGVAVLVTATSECGADSCDGSAFLLTASGPVVALPFGGHAACAPDGSFAVADVAQMPASEEGFLDPRRWTVVLQKFPADGSPPSHFADCMSPALSPDGLSFLCRDGGGAVLQVDAGGGPTRIVARAGVPPERVSYDPQSFLYPTPPRFSGSELRFDVETADGRIEHAVPWPPAAEPRPGVASPPPAPRRPNRRNLPSCGETLCNDEGDCYGPSPPHCR